jgi:hypothetical protein
MRRCTTFQPRISPRYWTCFHPVSVSFLGQNLQSVRSKLSVNLSRSSEPQLIHVSRPCLPQHSHRPIPPQIISMRFSNFHWDEETNITYVRARTVAASARFPVLRVGDIDSGSFSTTLLVGLAGLAFQGIAICTDVFVVACRTLSRDSEATIPCPAFVLRYLTTETTLCARFDETVDRNNRRLITLMVRVWTASILAVACSPVRLVPPAAVLGWCAIRDKHPDVCICTRACVWGHASQSRVESVCVWTVGLSSGVRGRSSSGSSFEGSSCHSCSSTTVNVWHSSMDWLSSARHIVNCGNMSHES